LNHTGCGVRFDLRECASPTIRPDRYAIGDRDDLKFNADGSLDLPVQRDSPGADKEANWLPALKEGGFSLTMRLYWPKPGVLDGTWSPPQGKQPGQ
jgi:hypothetical protein